MAYALTPYIPAFHASPACGLADFNTQEAKAMHTKHMSDCLRGRREASNPTKRKAGLDEWEHPIKEYNAL